MKKKKTEFYLLRQKSLSEGDLFVTDYIKTKQRLDKLKDEDEVFPKNTYNTPETSRLNFVTVDSMGGVFANKVNVDKSFEGKMLMFPAKLPHLVYPFYTSNKYRITVSGNIKLKVVR